MRIDNKRMARLVIDLNILRKNILMYPQGHNIVNISADQTYGSMRGILDIMPEITFGIVKDCLLVDQECLDPKNPGHREFALTLSQYDIASITFSQGLDKSELLEFLSLLSTKPEDIRGAGGLEKAIDDAPISHIKVQCIDFGKFQFTEEAEIVRPQTVKQKDVWQDFAANLLSGTTMASESGQDIRDPTRMDPAKLAQLMNDQKLDPHTAIKSYQRILSEQVQEATLNKEETGEKSPILEKFNTLIKQLNPDLKQQFLSATFNQCASKGTHDALVSFPDDMVIEMISQANREGREISPSLLRFVQKISNVRDDDARSDRPSQSQSARMSKEQFRELFKREQVENFVGSDYGAMIQNLTGSPEADLPRDESPFPLEELMPTMDRDHIDIQIARVLQAYMNRKMDEDDYNIFLNRLISTLDILLERGEFRFLLTTFKTLSKHRFTKRNQGIKTLAEKALTSFQDLQFITKVVHAIETSSKRKGRDALNFLVALGPRTIPTVLDHYMAKDDQDEEDILFNLLYHFKHRTVNLVKKRLKHPDIQIVRNLLRLASRLDGQTDVAYLKRLLHHHDQDVRLDALGALVRLKDPWATILLRKSLRSKEHGECCQAIALAGSYRITEMTQDLIAKIRRMAFFKTDYEMNEKIITALGKIVDPTAIPMLEKLAKGSWTLYPKGLLHMKRVLFESLDHYPFEVILNLVAIGSRLSDETIHNACKKLVKKNQRPAKRGRLC
ncbi:MAG: HEAT repeat domain-containing protein [bacterium]